MEARGMSVVGPTEHDGFILSIYFFDPSGHRLELTVRTAPPERLLQFEAEAPAVLELWDQDPRLVAPRGTVRRHHRLCSSRRW
jgi:glyoxylase I family protein